MDLEDALAADHVGIGHDDLAVEPARTQQGRIEHVGPIRRGNENDAFIGVEPVHFDEQLVQSLLALVVAAAKAGAAVAPDRINFVDEYDAGRVFLRLLEHVAHSARPDADEHFDEIRAGNGKERHVGLAGDGAREQGFPGAGRTDEQDAARNPAAEPLELLRIAQKFDNLLQIFLSFIDAGDVVERHPPMRLGQQFCFGLAKAHSFAARPLHLPRQENPDAEEGYERQAVDQQRDDPIIAIRRGFRRDLHVLLVEGLHQSRIIRRISRESAAIVEMPGNLITGDRHFADVALIDLVEKLAEADVLRRGALPRVLEQHHQGDDQQKNDDPERKIPEIRIHLRPATGNSPHRARIACSLTRLPGSAGLNFNVGLAGVVAKGSNRQTRSDLPNHRRKSKPLRSFWTSAISNLGCRT